MEFETKDWVILLESVANYTQSSEHQTTSLYMISDSRVTMTSQSHKSHKWPFVYAACSPRLQPTTAFIYPVFSPRCSHRAGQSKAEQSAMNGEV